MSGPVVTNVSNHRRLNLKDGGIIDCYPSFLPKHFADALYAGCRVGGAFRLPWALGTVTVGARTVTEPRLTCFLGRTDGLEYTYSNKLNVSTTWPDMVAQLKDEIEKVVGGSYNVVLMNWYENGNHHVSWHSDSEVDLSAGSSIATISLGETRLFQMRHKEDSLMGARKAEVGNKQKQGLQLSPEDLEVLRYQPGIDPELNHEVPLSHGDMLVMGGTMQQFWRHRVPPVTTDIGPRIVFTFRSVANDML